MYQPIAEAVPVDPNAKPPKSMAELLIEDLENQRKDILKSKESALAYLKSIGVTFDKNGNMKVTPL